MADYDLGLDENAIEERDNLSPIDRMIFDIERDMSVVVGFCERQQEDNADTLRAFLVLHPEFGCLLRPILDLDPEYGGGEIRFTPQDGGEIEAVIRAESSYGHEAPEMIELRISFDFFKQFIRLVDPFACFMTNNGEEALNFG